MLIVLSGGYLAWQFFASSQTTKPQPTATGTVTLNFWGVFDDESAFSPIIAAYRKTHPGVTVTYTRKEASLYEFASLNLLAAQNNGPDVWLIPQEWLPKHRDKLTTVPEGLLAAQNQSPAPRRLFQKASPIPSNATLYNQTFAPVTAEQNVINGQVYTLPLAVDTLGLYANRPLLHSLGVDTLPQTWEAIVESAKKITKRSGVTITQPGIALGTSNNISRASDIVAALLIQNHTPMVSDDKTEALYNQAITKATGEPIKPGALALDFYTSFASPTKETFSWSQALPNDFELFSSGQLPLMIDYSYRIRDLIAANPTLSFETSPLPQIAGTNDPKTLASALVLGVPSVSQHQQAAWSFIQFLTNRENDLAYARATSRPPARIDAAGAPLSEPRLAPFINQIPYATLWYRNEINKTDQVIKQAIDAILASQPIEEVVNKLTKQVTHILRNEPYE